MKSPKKILVTVRYDKHDVDFEMPTDVQISEIKSQIINILNAYFSDMSINDKVTDEVEIYYKNTKLMGDKILVNYGIWDGAIIEVR